MKTINKNGVLLGSIIILSLTFFSCTKVENETMTVIKDCTGSYLRFNNKDYLICNRENVTPFDNGTEVQATFKKVKNCSDCLEQPFICCMVVHENEGLIEIEKIKQIHKKI